MKLLEVEMKRQLKSGLLCAVFVALLAAGCSGSGSTDTASAPGKDSKAASGGSLLDKLTGNSTTPVEVAEATEISITLDQAISSESAKSGEEFTATVAQPVVVGGKTVIPKGATARGLIVEAKESGRLKGVALLRLALNAVEVDGKVYEIKTAVISRQGQDHKKRNTVMIGGGAGAGAAIGALAGGGKGALIGGAIGAGAGTAGAAATGKKDITLGAETALKFKLSEAVTVQVKK
jgi:hypothetical protein